MEFRSFLSIVCVLALAHHSHAQFEANKMKTYSGYFDAIAEPAPGTPVPGLISIITSFTPPTTNQSISPQGDVVATAPSTNGKITATTKGWGSAAITTGTPSTTARVRAKAVANGAAVTDRARSNIQMISKVEVTATTTGNWTADVYGYVTFAKPQAPAKLQQPSKVVVAAARRNGAGAWQDVDAWGASYDANTDTWKLGLDGSLVPTSPGSYSGNFSIPNIANGSQVLLESRAEIQTLSLGTSFGEDTWQALGMVY